MQILKHFPLSDIVYYKIGPEARIVLKIQNKEDFMEALDYLQKNAFKRILPLGIGSNILINNSYEGAVLWFAKGESSSIRLKEETIIEAFASDILDDVIQFAFKNNLTGLEWAGGLPSTVGGAVRGNAGAFGGEIARSVDGVEIAELLNGYEIKQLTKDELEFGYRDSFIKQNKQLLVVSATFKLQKATDKQVEQAKKVYHEHISYRNTHHAMDYPSCGSVFKNIREKEQVEKILAVWPDIQELVGKKWYGKVAMGYINKRLGFSGYQIGGAQVSEKHANYIVNKNKATFDDVVAIIDAIKEKFYNTFGFYPEPEVEIIY